MKHSETRKSQRQFLGIQLQGYLLVAGHIVSSTLLSVVDVGLTPSVVKPSLLSTNSPIRDDTPLMPPDFHSLEGNTYIPDLFIFKHVKQKSCREPKLQEPRCDYVLFPFSIVIWNK